MSQRRSPTVHLGTADPGVNDDLSVRCYPGDLWVRRSTGGAWVLTDDADGAAVWLAVGGGGGGGGGDNITVVATAATDVVFGSTPAAPAGSLNVSWAINTATAPDSVSASVSATQLLDVLGSTRGQVLYRNATAWTVLSPGTSGHLLRTGGAGADPSWGMPRLDELSTPTSSVGFGQQQLTSARIENRTSDPASPAEGEIWLRTDL